MNPYIFIGQKVITEREQLFYFVAYDLFVKQYSSYAAIKAVVIVRVIIL